MATSKSDPKQPQVMDVTHPGKTAPPASAKPIIVSNRPILKQDPMVLAPEGADKPEPASAPPVARAPRSITVIRPLSESERAAIITQPPAVTPVVPQNPAPASKAAKDTGASPHSVKITDMPDIGLEPVAGASVPSESIDKEVLGEPVPSLSKSAELIVPKPEDTPAKAPEAPEPKPESEPMPAVEPAKDASEEPTPASEATPSPEKPEQSASPAPASNTPSDVTESESSDEQLAPNQALDAAKQKEEEAKAALVAEQEKIIASKQYYLPIQNTAKRGTFRSLIILVVVILLTAVWLDAVLDAGIVHIGGVQALTNFFK